jgi:hypothetical protein
MFEYGPLPPSTVEYLWREFNPLKGGRGRVSPSFFLSSTYEKRAVVKIRKKYLFLGKCISYHLSLVDFPKKSLFHMFLTAFLGFSQISGLICHPPHCWISLVFYYEGMYWGGGWHIWPPAPVLISTGSPKNNRFTVAPDIFV